MAPDTAAAVLYRALKASGREAIPENPLRVRELAEGPLRYAIEELVSLEAAEAFLSALGPLLDAISSGVQRRSERITPRARPPMLPATRSSSPPPRRDEARLRLLVVTGDGVDDLRRQIGVFADVTHVRDAFELITAIEIRNGPVLVVVDGYRPVLDLTTLAAFLPRVPDGVRMAIWGFEAQDVRRMESLPGYTLVEAGPTWSALADALLRL